MGETVSAVLGCGTVTVASGSNPPPTVNLNREADWRKFVLRATALGVTHASLNCPALNEDRVFAVLTEGHSTMHRRFHARLLRVAYGAGYNGIAKTREALTKGF